MIFDVYFYVAEAIRLQEVDKIESARWATLTPEQQSMELRLREVRALERQARAMENTHREVHHHFFS